MQPGTLSDSDPAGKFLIALMNKPFTRHAEVTARNEIIELMINRHHVKSKISKNEIDQEGVKRFNLWIHALIKAEFISFIENALMIDGRFKVDRLIRIFEEKYKLHDTCMNFSTLKRNWHRYRLRKKISANLSSNRKAS